MFSAGFCSHFRFRPPSWIFEKFSEVCLVGCLITHWVKGYLLVWFIFVSVFSCGWNNSKCNFAFRRDFNFSGISVWGIKIFLYSLSGLDGSARRSGTWFGLHVDAIDLWFDYSFKAGVDGRRIARYLGRHALPTYPEILSLPSLFLGICSSFFFLC